MAGIVEVECVVANTVVGVVQYLATIAVGKRLIYGEHLRQEYEELYRSEVHRLL